MHALLYSANLTISCSDYKVAAYRLLGGQWTTILTRPNDWCIQRLGENMRSAPYKSDRTKEEHDAKTGNQGQGERTNV
jgi:hypothetical protein